MGFMSFVYDVFFFKQKTAYEMRISDWSSDVCSSDLSRYPRGETMLLAFFDILQLLLTVLTWIIIIQAILSWLVAFNVINTYNDFVRSLLNALDRITEPLYRPIRRILPDFGGIDFSPLVVLLLIYVIRILLSGVAADVAY